MSNIQNILIITNSIDMGGRETRLLGEMKALKKQYGIDFHFINLFNNNSERATQALSKYASINNYDLPSDVKDISVSLVMNTSAKIIKYCRIHDVDALYIHNSDIEALIGAFVAQQLKIPIFGTLHGKGMVFSNRLNPVLHFIFFYLIAPKLSLTVTMSYSLMDIVNKYPISKFLVIPNLIDTKFFALTPQNSSKSTSNRWLIVSRLSIEKYLGILKFIEYAFKSDIEGIDIAGDGALRSFLESEVSDCGIEGFVNFLGEKEINSELLSQYRVIVGVGRVILEAVASKKPAFVIGTGAMEDMSGFITEKNIVEAAYENFSGRNLESLNYDEFQIQLDSIETINLESIQKYVVKHHSESVLLESYTNHLVDLKFNDNPLIADLYASLGYFRNSIPAPFYLNDSFLLLLDNLVYSEYYADGLERAYILMRKRLRDKAIYPNKHHQKRDYLKVNRPVLKGETILSKEGLIFYKEPTALKCKQYNYDINSKLSYIVFIHFHHTIQKVEDNYEPIELTVQFELYDLKRKTSIICSTDFRSIAFNNNLGFYRKLQLNKNNQRDGIRIELQANIAIKAVKIFSSNIPVSISKLHTWVTY